METLIKNSLFFRIFEFLPDILYLLCSFQCIFDIMSNSLCIIIHFLTKFITNVIKWFIFILSKLLLFSLSSSHLLLLILFSHLSLLTFDLFCIFFNILIWILCWSHSLSKLSLWFLSLLKISHILTLLLTMKIIHKLFSKIHIIPSFSFLISSILTFLTRRFASLSILIIAIRMLIWSWWTCFSYLIILIFDIAIREYLICLIDLFE